MNRKKIMYALSDYTSGTGRFFTTFAQASAAGNEMPTKNDAQIITMKMIKGEYVAVHRVYLNESEALENELEAIDNTCEDCGGPITTREASEGCKPVGTYHECEGCRRGEYIPNGELANLHQGEVILTPVNSSFYIANPRSLWTKSESFGTWDILKGEDGYLSFPSARDAKEFAEKPYAHNNEPDINYYIVEIKG